MELKTLKLLKVSKQFASDLECERKNNMKYLIGILFIILVLFAIGGVIYFFVLEDIQTKNYIKGLKKLDEINKE